MSDSTNPSEAGALHKLDEMPAAYPHKEEKKPASKVRMQVS